MRLRKSCGIVFVLCCLMTVSGCFYLRLQKVKDQLAKFDKYFEIQEGEKFIIVAKEPVLFSADVIQIMDTKPSSQTEEPNKLCYDYVLQKQYAAQKDEDDNFDISMRFIFVEDKLTDTHIDKSFFAVIPKNIFIAILQSLGNSKVDIKKRKIHGGHGVAGEIHLPDANEVQLLLGKPYTKEDNVYTYKYLRINPEKKSVTEKDYLPVIFTFDEDGNLLKCRSKILGGWNELDFNLRGAEIKAEASDANSVERSDSNSLKER